MDNLVAITTFFGWCLVINIGLLAFMTLMLTISRGFVKPIHSKLSGVSPDDLDAIYFNFLANYKLAIMVFSLVPYIALRLMA